MTTTDPGHTWGTVGIVGALVSGFAGSIVMFLGGLNTRPVDAVDSMAWTIVSEPRMTIAEPPKSSWDSSPAVAQALRVRPAAGGPERDVLLVGTGVQVADAEKGKTLTLFKAAGSDSDGPWQTADLYPDEALIPIVKDRRVVGPAAAMTIPAVAASIAIAGHGARLARAHQQTLPAARPAPAGAPGPDPRERLARDKHGGVLTAYGAYECSLLDVFTRPALADISVPTTAAFHTAAEHADDTRTLLDAHPTTGHDTALTRYEAAVLALTAAWRAADGHATQAGQHHLADPRDRTRLRRATGLLRHALDDALGAPARQNYLDRALTTADGLVHPPRRAVTQIEATLPRPEITR